ncbi:tetratricopeptide repeat protein [Aeromonas jandaei]|uniref:tetratricopeptide repeat protein n=1 Tax=Aeromonas jandaei TaxID=650 RepID=UPI0019336429|nr:tetratricopeptide repeat protein [Aeromonas jandaei]MBM0491209.1 tetratricopeptide repeat protein [Aeromonas jandaei]MBM0568257.1 tetratricopeptide repeat protein [Aeromonas jandaei]
MNKLHKMILAPVAMAVLLSTASWAAEQPALSDRAYRAVNKAQELITDKQYGLANARLQEALSSAGDRVYDKGVILQTLGFVAAQQEKYGQATKYFADAIATGGLPPPVAQQVRYNLAQLYMAEGNFQGSIKTMREWFANQGKDDKPNSHAYITLANAHVQLKQYREAIPAVDQAIKLSAGKAPESWYLLKMAAHYELKQYKQATEVLTILVDMHPQQKKYWTQLSAMHMQAGNDSKALAALEAAYSLGMLTEPAELQRLANYLAFSGIPHRAARVMEKGMKDGVIEQSASNYKTLANYWHQAKELDPAIDTLAKSYQLVPNAELQLKMARMMIQSKRYQDLVELAAKPAANANGEQRADLKFLTGVAYFEQQKPKEALNAFTQAAQNGNVSGRASPWISFLKEQSGVGEAAVQ